MADYNSTFTGAQIDAGITKANSAQQPPAEGPFVDGDKTKLDGIEAGADVTDTANVTAAGALMDSEVTNLAAVKAFDPTDYATAAQGGLADTALQSVTGTTDEVVVTGGDTISLASAVTGSLALADSAVQPGDDADTLGSGDATDGWVLTADGAGGAAWEAAAGGGGSTDYVRTRAGAIQDLFDMADTWNEGTTTFTAIKMNVTDTASASGSLLMDLQVGGASKFSIGKLGNKINFTDPTYGAAAIQANGARIDFIPGASGGVGKVSADFAGRFCALSTVQIGSIDQANAKVVLARDDDDVLALRRSTNAQTLNIYNTYTDASNYERGFMRWDGNELGIGTVSAGTGGDRSVGIYSNNVRYQIIGSNFNQFDKNLYMNGANIVTGGAGFKIGTAANQPIGFWNATPVVQPTTGISAGSFVANTSGIINDTATFDGYTIGQVVAALRQIGLLA